MRNFIKNHFLAFIGLEADTTSHGEKMVSTIGGFAGILMVVLVSGYFVGPTDAALMAASIGASAVLLFAMPHGTLSQPWPLVGGHVISALVGVTVAKFIPGIILPAALAVALAIGAMHYLRCIHPPGGATALTAVIGGPAVHALGYQYVLAPVLLNTGIILCAAIVVNYFFPWRRYPAKFRREKNKYTDAGLTASDISREDLEFALRKMNIYVDVTEQDLKKIYALARKHSLGPHLTPDDIRTGAFYTNGKYGDRWSIYQVIDESSAKDQVIFKVIAGKQRGHSGIMAREKFAQSVQHEVTRNENSWQRTGGAESNKDRPNS